MPRTITEQHTFPKQQLEELAKSIAKLRIVNGFYLGKFEEQTASWQADGSITIVTTHTPEEWPNAQSK
jgi:NOL1/NOP2/fmu family ribosome biogenesis protein